uniref:Ribonuclease H-like domain-containing protein n=1 Tax=Tanacetum cinerariifolium TaxID=118510 RepID=A0A6L2N9H9_TANCI|nr:ribonuclease H-like domain-containing protein [Tanacetum cinerariifolium]
MAAKSNVPQLVDKKGGSYSAIAPRLEDGHFQPKTVEGAKKPEAQWSNDERRAFESVNWLWHKRLSHLNFKNITKLAKKNKVLGLPSLVYSKDKPCSSFKKGKHHTGLYEFRVFTLFETEAPRLQKEEDLRGDDLKHYEAEIEKLINASRAKKVEKSHDPFALVAHTSSSSRTTTPYYVTHPSLVVDYDDDYQGDAVQKNSEDPLTSAMIFLARHYTRNYPKPRVQDSKYFMEQMLLAKQDEAGVILTDEQNDFLFADASRMEGIEKLSANICLMAMIQLTNFNFDEGPSYDSAFLSEAQSILKRRMSEKEDKYHDMVLDVEASAKKNEDVVLKMGNSLQGMFMLGPKPMSFYDSKVKHGLGYTNPYTLKKANFQNPKLYYASSLDDSKVQINVRDTEDILDDASKSQIKMKKKSQDPIAIEKKQNFWTIDYIKLNALYEDFVPQKEFLAEQKYFSSSFIYSENSSNASSPYSSSVTKPSKSVNTKFGKDTISHNLFCVTPLNKPTFQKKTVAPKTEVKHVLSKTVTLQTSPNKQQAVNTNKHVIAPRMYKVEKTQNTNTNNVKSVLSSTGLRSISSVRRPSHRDSLFKNSVLSNTKNSLEKVEVSDKTYKKLDIASKNVNSNKKIVTNDDFKNAFIAKNILCVSCSKNVLIPCHDNCLENHKLNVHPKFRRALFTTSRTVKSKFKDPTPVVLKTMFSVKTVQSKSLDTTPVVSKTKIAAVTLLSAKHKVSSAFKLRDHEAPPIVTTSEEQTFPIPLNEADETNQEDSEDFDVIIMAQTQRSADVHQDDLCPPNKCYALMDANKKIDLDNLLYPNESKIMANILQIHPLRFSVTASSSVSWIYLGRIFHLPQVIDNNHERFVIAPKFSEMVLFFLNTRGFTLELQSPSNFKTILSWMITDEMKLTDHYRMYVMVFEVDVPTTQSQPIESTKGTHMTPSVPRSPNHDTNKGESSALRKSTVIRLRIPQRRSTRLTPPTLIPTTAEADDTILQDIIQLSLAEQKSHDELEA